MPIDKPVTTMSQTQAKLSHQFFTEIKGNVYQKVKVNVTLTKSQISLQFQKGKGNCLSLSLQDIFIQVLQSQVKKTKIGFGLYFGSKYIILKSHNEKIIKNWEKVLSKHIFPTNFEKIYASIVKIGSGAFGQVFKIKRKQDGKIFAGKFIKKDEIKKNPKFLLNQIKILKMLNYESLVKYEAIYSLELHICIVMQILEGENLVQKLQKTPNLSQEQIKHIMKQLLKALVYLKENKIIHRDLKPQNIVFRNKESSAYPIIVDFGLATLTTFASHLHYKCGTPGYMAPQILKAKTIDQIISQNCDIYSLGAVFYLMLTKRKLFQGKDKEAIKEKNLKAKIDFKYSNLDIDAQDLLTKMLEINPQKRISVEQALEHEYFTQQLLQQQVLKFQRDQSFYLNDQEDRYFGNSMIYSQRPADINKSWNFYQFND